MKQISKGYYIAAGALLIWAGMDFFHYFVIGQDLLSHYEGEAVMVQLVRNSLFQGIGKMLLSDLILLIGWLRRGKKERQLPRSTPVIAALLALSILGTWLVSMGCLTAVTAQEIFDQLYAVSYDFPDTVDRSGMLGDFYDPSFSRYGYQYQRPDVLEWSALRAISQNASRYSSSQGAYGSYSQQGSKLIRDVRYPMETAVLFYDGAGNLLHSSDEDVLFFTYYTQAEWDAGKDSASGLHYGWMDMSQGKDAENPEDDPYRMIRAMYAAAHNLYALSALRVTGTFSGNELLPRTLEYVTDTQIHQVLESTDAFSTGESSYAYTVSGVDRTGLLDWQTLFDRGGAYQGEDLVTVYIQYPEMWTYEAEPLTYEGMTYESLAALTKELDFPPKGDIYSSSNTFRSMSKYGLTELLVFSGWRYADYARFEGDMGETPETELILITAIRSNPLACAVSALRNIYIVTGLIALALVAAVQGQIRKNLTQPMENVIRAMENGGELLYHPEGKSEMWREAQRLIRAYEQWNDLRRMRKNEIARLNAALKYARDAEENRRQMTSNIAHELKTPLAVIHSYAEGLQERIAEDKRDKYLQVILSETQRMDSMVLEMLDLSRLEAGKVKLSRDPCSLIRITRSVFEKLERAAQTKNLQITYQFPEDFTVTVDESRITQVIENFATNAVKYTPVGGKIRVRIQNSRGKISFSVENQCSPLPQEVLDKVWDTFYRAEESRPEGGTGLGLAIARSIIQLHGGTCSAENTDMGVLFRFTLTQ